MVSQVWKIICPTTDHKYLLDKLTEELSYISHLSVHLKQPPSEQQASCTNNQKGEAELRHHCPQWTGSVLGTNLVSYNPLKKLKQLHKPGSYNQENRSTILSLHEPVCFMILMNTYRQDRAKSFCEEDPNKWYHCRNSCISHVQSLEHTAQVFADMSQQNWYCSDMYCW